MRYVALLRGINVGGHAKLPMADLRALLASLGHGDVATYLQSGNALFTSPRDNPDELAQEIESRIAGDLGLQIRVLMRTPDEMAAVVDSNPYKSAVETPTRLHVSFLLEQPSRERLEELDAERYLPDQFEVGDRVLYFWLPNGAAESKMMRDLPERRLGVVATTRNWNTVTKLLDLARS